MRVKSYCGICRSKTSYLIQRRHIACSLTRVTSSVCQLSTRARLTARCHWTTTLLRRYQLDYNVPCSGRLRLHIVIISFCDFRLCEYFSQLLDHYTRTYLNACWKSELHIHCKTNCCSISHENASIMYRIIELLSSWQHIYSHYEREITLHRKQIKWRAESQSGLTAKKKWVCSTYRQIWIRYASGKWIT